VTDTPKRAGFFGWFGFANTEQFDAIQCFICQDGFASRYPNTGDSVICPHCGAEGYGTFDGDGNYMLEWYENEN